MNAAKAKGTAWETAIVNYLRAWWPHAERRTQGGFHDRGDISGLPGVVVEAKSSGRNWRLPEWWAEVETEIINVERNFAAGPVHHGVLWIKRVGKTDPARGWVIMDGETYVRLLKDAGW